MKRHVTLLTGLLVVLCVGLAARADKTCQNEGWVSLFDGKTMTGWKASENASSWKVENGALVCHGPRSYLSHTASPRGRGPGRRNSAKWG